MKRRLLAKILAGLLIIGSANTGVSAQSVDTVVNQNINTSVDRNIDEVDSDLISQDSTEGPEIVEEAEEKVEAEIAVNATNFPDSVFRGYIQSRFGDTLSETEISSVTYMTFSSSVKYTSGGTTYYLNNITNFTGLQYFTSVNKITITKSTTLKSISRSDLPENLVTFYMEQCSNVYLKNLDLSGLTKLRTLSINDNTKLQSVNLDNCTAYTGPAATSTTLGIYKNGSLQSVSMKNCTALKVLNVFNNGNLTTLDITGSNAITTMNISRNALSSIDVTGYPALITLDCEYNDLTELDLSKNTKLTTLKCGGSNKLPKLDVTHITTLTTVNCAGCSTITELKMNYLAKQSIAAFYGCSSLKNVTFVLTNKTTGTVSLGAMTGNGSSTQTLDYITDTNYNTSTKTLTFTPADYYNESLGKGVYPVGNSNYDSFNIEYTDYEGKAAVDKPVTAISLTANKENPIIKNESVRITATVTPSDATDRNIVWSSSSGLVSISQYGLYADVIALGSGTATVIATNTKSGVSQSYELQIVVPTTDFTLDTTEALLDLDTDSTKTINVTGFTPQDATDREFTFESSDTSVATVSGSGTSATIQAVGKGDATIKVALKSNPSIFKTVSVAVNKVENIYVTGFDIPASISLDLNSTYIGSVAATNITPSDATFKAVSYQSANTAVATVDDYGNVTGVSVGTTTITVKAKDDGGYSKTVTVTVERKPILVTKITLNSTSKELRVGDVFYVLAKSYEPSTATTKGVTYSVVGGGTSVVTVGETNGAVIAKGTGTATVRATATDGSGVYADCEITVYAALVSSITVKNTSMTLDLNGTYTGKIEVTDISPANAGNKNLSYTSLNQSVATVDESGNVTGKSVGNTTITVAATDGSNTKTSVTINVVRNPIAVTKVNLVDSEKTITVGQTYTVAVNSFEPSNATTKGVTYSLVGEDKGIITVDTEKGLVTALAVGTATVRATAIDGSKVYADCVITVKPVLVQKINVKETEITLDLNSVNTGWAQVTSVLPSNAADKSLSYTSADTSIATVDISGYVTGKAVGETYITIAAADGSGVTATVNVKVVKNAVKVTKITLNESSKTIRVGDTFTASVKAYEPSNATTKGVTYSVVGGGTSVVTVNSTSGLVTAKGQGTATVRATATDGSGVYADCAVTVNPALVTSITVKETTLNLDLNGTKTGTIEVTSVLPSYAGNKTVSYTSANTGIASVDASGNVTAKAVGNTTITVAATDGSGVTATVTVYVTKSAIKVTKITLNETSKTVRVADTFTVSVKSYEPSTATTKGVTYSVVGGGTSVVTVNSTSGLVTAKGTGTATVRATATDGSGVYADCAVTVNPALVTSITVKETTLNLDLNGTKTGTIEVTSVLPSYAGNKTVSYTSANTSIASVDASGNVTAKAVGNTTITVAATDGSGVTATVTVYVTKSVIKVTKITLNETSKTVRVADTFTASVKAYEPSNATTKGVTYSVVGGGTSVVTVNSTSGLVTAKGQGTATVRATATDGSGVYADCAVTVNPALVTSITVKETTLNLDLNGTKTGTIEVTSVLPSYAGNKTVSYTSANTSIASVDASGNVTAKAVGNTTITVAATDGSGVTATVTVYVTKSAIKVTKITLNESSKTIRVADTFTVSVKSYEPSTATTKGVTYSVVGGGTSVVTVNSTSGLVTAKGTGTATVRATATDGSGVYADCAVTVNPALVSQITLKESTINLDLNGTKTGTIEVTSVLPSYAGNKTVSYTSANTSIASVDASGNVTAKAVGNTTITVAATDGSGVTATVTVYVTKSAIKVTSIEVKTDSINLDLNGTKTGKVEVTSVLPANATNKAVSYSSEKTGVATVDASGNVTAKSVGSTVITVKAADGSGVVKYVTVYVVDTTVKYNAVSTGLYITGNGKYLEAGHSAYATGGNSEIEYSWYVEKDGKTQMIQDWTKGTNTIKWHPNVYGNITLIGKVRLSDNKDSVSSSVKEVEVHPYLSGTCQMPNPNGSGFLIGLTKYADTDEAVCCKMLVLNCSLLAAGLPAWVYETEYCGFADNGMWTVWDPEYGYFWTLFRIYDKDGNIIDEICYGFVNT